VQPVSRHTHDLPLHRIVQGVMRFCFGMPGACLLSLTPLMPEPGQKTAGAYPNLG
jgi:hypothetical protein